MAIIDLSADIRCYTTQYMAETFLVEIIFLDTKFFDKSNLFKVMIRDRNFQQLRYYTISDDLTPEDETRFTVCMGYYLPITYEEIYVNFYINETDYHEFYPSGRQVEFVAALAPYFGFVETPDAGYVAWKIPERANRWKVRINFNDYNGFTRYSETQLYLHYFLTDIGYHIDKYKYPINGLTYHYHKTAIVSDFLGDLRFNYFLGGQWLSNESLRLYKLNTPTYNVDMWGNVSVLLDSPDYEILGTGRSVSYILVEYENVNENSSYNQYSKLERDFFMETVFNNVTAHWLLIDGEYIWKIPEYSEMGADGKLCRWEKDTINIRVLYHPTVDINTQNTVDGYLTDWIGQVNSITGLNFNIVLGSEDFLIEVGSRLELGLDNVRSSSKELLIYSDIASIVGCFLIEVHGQDATLSSNVNENSEIHYSNIKLTTDTISRPETLKRLFWKYCTMALGLNHENYRFFESMLNFFPSNLEGFTNFEEKSLQLLYNEGLPLGGSRSLIASIINGINIKRSPSSANNFSLENLQHGETYRHRIWVTGMTNEMGIYQSIYSYKSDWKTFRYGIDKPSAWVWTGLNGSGEQFNLTADEWNAFTNRINEFRTFKNLPQIVFQTVSVGEKLTAVTFLQAANALFEMTDSVALECRNVEMDGIVYRWYLDNLAAATNYI